MSALASAGTAELAAKLNDFMTEYRLPGATAAVVHGDELAWIAGSGFADQDARRPSQPGTLYRIASITKTFTGTAVMQLRDAGRLDLDDPAVAYLPELRNAVSPFAAIETVTIRRMLSHESGLAAEPPGTDWSVPRYQGAPEATLARASDIVLTFPPNRQHKYSDLAYQLLGEIVTRVSGIPYPLYMRGIYAGSGLAGGVLRLEWRDGKLAFVSQEPAPFRLTLEPTSDPDTFIAEQDFYFAGENVTFHRRADGRVTSVFLVASTFVRLDQVPAGP